MTHTKYQRMILLSIIAFSSFIIADARIESQTIIESIRAREAVQFQNITITGDLDFTELCDKDSTLPGKEETVMEKVLGIFVDINIEENQEVQCDIEVTIEFIDCTFQDRVVGWVNDEKNAISYNAVFQDKVEFSNCNFKDEFLFKYSEFNGKTIFSENNFKKTALFKYADFSQSVSFAKSIFSKEANFKYTKFPQNTKFAGSHFKNAANFKYTDFEDFVDFSEVSFNSEANFKYTKFPKGVSFENTTFSANADFKYAKFSNPVNLKGTKFDGGTAFKYTTIDGGGFVQYLLNNQN